MSDIGYAPSIATVFRKPRKNIVQNDTDRALHRSGVFMRAKIAGGVCQKRTNIGIRKNFLFGECSQQRNQNRAGCVADFDLMSFAVHRARPTILAEVAEKAR